jgi:hypothetical protein
MEFDPLATVSDISGGGGSSSEYPAIVSGPSWRVLLSAADFADFVHMLGQLRMAVASLRFQGLWNAGSKDRPPSKAKVCLVPAVQSCDELLVHEGKLTALCWQRT